LTPIQVGRVAAAKAGHVHGLAFVDIPFDAADAFSNRVVFEKPPDRDSGNDASPSLRPPWSFHAETDGRAAGRPRRSIKSPKYRSHPGVACCAAKCEIAD
jgi:hypothetical protein